MNTSRHRDFTFTIDGAGRSADDRLEVVNPAIGEPFAACPAATEQDLADAIAAARAAFRAWSACSFEERRSVISTFTETIERNADELATLLTLEQGKPLSNSMAEIGRAIDHTRRICRLPLPDETLLASADEDIVLRYRPHGVVGAIVPWNSPVVLAMHKVAHALYTGNTMVLKPSPYTPLTALMLGELSRGILPPGVLNVIAGWDLLGSAMTAHNQIDMIAFTGSVATGKKVIASGAQTMKRITAELGGNDAALVLRDVDLQAALRDIFASAMANCGQICMAVKRLYVPRSLHQEALELLGQMVREIRVGDGMDPGVHMGPVQNYQQFQKLQGLIAQTARTPGAALISNTCQHPDRGYFIRPAIVAGLPDSAPLVTQEQFGPILPILSYDSVEDAVNRINDTRFGLGASVWGRNEEAARKIAEKLMAGTTWVNTHGGAHPEIPFCGAKESGLGAEMGVLGLRSYMAPHVIHVKRRYA